MPEDFSDFTPDSLPNPKGLSVSQVKGKIRMMAESGFRWTVFRAGELSEGARAGLVVAGFKVTVMDGGTMVEW